MEPPFKTALFNRVVLWPASVSAAMRQSHPQALNVIQEGGSLHDDAERTHEGAPLGP